MNIVQYLNKLSDTELRVILVVMNIQTPLSVADIQEMAGRGRQVYTAIKSLRKREIIAQHDAVLDGKVTKWRWSCIWDFHGSSESTPVHDANEMTEQPLFDVSEEIAPVVVSVEKENKVKKVKQPKGNPNQQHPAVLSYMEVTSRRPKQFVANAIADTVASEGSDLDAWKTVVQTWIMNGWNPTNVDGMLNMYRKRNAPDTQTRQRRRIVLTDEVLLPSAESQAAKLEEYLREHEE
jgi:hypothetical protein